MTPLHKRLSMALVPFVVLAVGAGCSSDNDDADPQDTETPEDQNMDSGGNSMPRFASSTATQENGGGEILIDQTTGLTWINGGALDSRGDGCVSPANVGATELEQANDRCSAQQYAGFDDWRAPTAEELSGMIQAAGAESVTLNYLVPECPALVATDGFVRTENANPTAASVHPDTATGDIFKDSGGNNISVLADLGLNAGVRCVRAGTDAEPTTAAGSARFSTAVAMAADGGGETLIDSMKSLEWINDTQLDSNGEGCISPGNVGATEPEEAEGRCENQNFAGYDDWRAPSSSELSDFITAAQTNGIKMNYLNPVCPALVATDGIVRTENANSAADTAFPDAVAGSVIALSVIDLNGINAGVRCVRDR